GLVAKYWAEDIIGLPCQVAVASESSRSVVDNLDKASKLGVQVDPEQWLSVRPLRNKMVHDYTEADEVFLNAINFAHKYEHNFFVFADEIIQDLKSRGIKEK
ncbi:MAG: hypothetical protein P1P78_14165, partial [Methyloprofundus sp.]|nr:hypothetical protein [Methyloprofundus sp.]